MRRAPRSSTPTDAARAAASEHAATRFALLQHSATPLAPPTRVRRFGSGCLLTERLKLGRESTQLGLEHVQRTLLLLDSVLALRRLALLGLQQLGELRSARLCAAATEQQWSATAGG